MSSSIMNPASSTKATYRLFVCCLAVAFLFLQVHTTFAQTKLQKSDCGKSNVEFNSLLKAKAVSGASEYEFLVEKSSMSYSQSVVKTTKSFKLEELSTQVSYNTKYDVKVRTKVGGSMGSYGPMCNVTTKQHPGTKLLGPDCGKIGVARDQLLKAEAVAGAAEYEFLVEKSSLAYSESVVKNQKSFKLEELAVSVDFNTMYDVKIRSKVGGVMSPFGPMCTITTGPHPLTKLRIPDCGKTGVALNDLLRADLVTGALEYEFRVENTSLAYSETIVKTMNDFSLDELSVAVNGSTTYNVKVRTKIGTSMGPYGPMCPVTTEPTSLVTQLEARDCRATNVSLNQILKADRVMGASQYDFLVENSALSFSQVVSNSNRLFRLSDLAGPIQFNTTYNVSVRATVGAIATAYGPVCQITTEANSAITQLQASDCGAAGVTLTQMLRADMVPGASQYEFLIENTLTGFSYNHVSNNRNLPLTQVPGLYQGAFYDITVRTTVGSTVHPYGPLCQILMRNDPATLDGVFDYEGGVIVHNPVPPTQALVVDRFNNVFKTPGGVWTPPLPSGTGGGNHNTHVAQTQNCSGFEVTFEDIVNGTGLGFDDHTMSTCPGGLTVGEERVNVVCAVFNYIASIIDLDVTTPDILVAQSEMDGMDALAVGSPLIDNTITAPAFTGGFLLSHIVGGTDLTTGAGEYDGYIRMDFGPRFSNGNLIPLNSCIGCPNGDLDLYSIILHEATHALGFFSAIGSPNGASIIGGPYSVFDQFIRDGNGDNLVISPGNFDGSSPDLISDVLDFFNAGNTIEQPVFSRNPYQDGTSLSHFDELKSGTNYVMRSSTSGGEDRKWTLPEIEALGNLGYPLLSPPIVPGNNYPIGVDDVGYSTQPGQEICVNVLANDIDANGNFIIFYGNCGGTCSNPGSPVQILNDPGGTAFVTFNSICYTPGATFSGTAILKYCPTDNLGSSNFFNLNNCAFLFVDVGGGFCPEDPCNLVCNGSFENAADPCVTTLDFSSFYLSSSNPCQTKVANWCRTIGTADLYVRSPCSGNFDIPDNVFTTLVPGGVDTYSPVSANGMPNHTYVGERYTTNGISEGIYTRLARPLIPGNNYEFSFWAFAVNGSGGSWPDVDGLIRASFHNAEPVIGTGNTPSTWYPATQSTTPGNYIEVIDNDWSQYTLSFVAPNIADLEYLIIEPEIPTGSTFLTYIYYDDVRVMIDETPLPVVKTLVSPANPTFSDVVTYNIQVFNPGGTAVTNITVEDLLPPALTATSPTTFNIATIPASGSVNLTVTATVNTDAPVNTPIDNCVIITSGGSNCLFYNTTNNCAEFTIPATDIAVNKTVGNSIAQSGSQVTYTVTVSNFGPADATNIVVQDVLPSGVSNPVVTFTPSGGGVVYNSGFLTIPALSNGNTLTMDITVDVDNNNTSGCTVLQNCATLFAMPDQIDLGLLNNSDCEPITVLPVFTVPPIPLFCETDPFFTLGVTPSGGTYTGNGIVFLTSVFFPGLAGVGTHTIQYTFPGSDPSCAVSFDIVVNATPPAPFASSYIGCGAPSNLIAFGTGIIWYSDPGLTNQIGTGSPFNPAGNLTTPGVTTLYVTQTVGGCESAAATVTVNVSLPPKMAFFALPCTKITDPCLDLTPFVIPGGGTFTGTGVSGTVFCPGVAGSGTFTITYSLISGACPSSTTQTITVAPLPPIAPSFVGCDVPSNLTAIGTGIIWYSDPGLSNQVGTGNSFNPSGLLTIPGTTTFYVTQTSGGCESEATAVIVQILNKPPPPVLLSVAACSTPVSLGAFGTGGTLTWYTDPGLATQVGTGSSINTTPFLTIPGTTTFYVTETDGITGCVSDAGIGTVDIFIAPKIAVSLMPDMCDADPCVDLTAFVSQSGGTFTGTGVNSFTAEFCPSVAGAGTHSITYTITSGPCSSTASLTVLVTSSGTSATWPKHPTGSIDEAGYGVAVDDNEQSYYVTGYFDDNIDFGNGTINSAGSSDLFVAKYQCGLEWVLTGGTAGFDFETGFAVAVADNGNVYVTGVFTTPFTLGSIALTNSGSGEKSFVAKLDPTNGNPIWARVIDPTSTTSQNSSIDIAVDNNSGAVYISGATYGGGLTFASITHTNAGGGDVFVAKYQDNGTSATEVWAVEYGTAGFDPGQGVDVDGSGNVYVISDKSGGPPKTTDVRKYNSSGTLQWAKTLTSSGAQVLGHDISANSSGNIFITGLFEGTVNFGTTSLTDIGGNDIFVASYDNAGTERWAVRLGVASGTVSDNGRAIEVRGNDVFVTGEYDSDMFTAKLDDSNNGNLLWLNQTVSSNSTKIGTAQDIATDPFGNAYVTGLFVGTLSLNTTLTAAVSDVFVARINNGGTFFKTSSDLPDETLSDDNITMGTSNGVDYQIYPNPTKGLLTVELSMKEDVSTRVVIYNVHGQELELTNKSESAENKFEFNLSDEPGGVYFVRIQAGYRVFSKRIVLVK